MATTFGCLTRAIASASMRSRRTRSLRGGPGGLVGDAHPAAAQHALDLVAGDARQARVTRLEPRQRGPERLDLAGGRRLAVLGLVLPHPIIDRGRCLRLP